MHLYVAFVNSAPADTSTHSVYVRQAEQRNARRAQQAAGAGAGGGRGATRALRPGDVLVTRHSNLDTHVIFHLVVDDSLKAGRCRAHVSLQFNVMLDHVSLCDPQT